MAAFANKQSSNGIRVSLFAFDKPLQNLAKWRTRFSGTRIADIRARVRLNDETTHFPTLNSCVPRSPRFERGIARRSSRLLDEVC
jgi:hypothetical protein